MKKVSILWLLLLMPGISSFAQKEKPAMVGVYYYDGWTTENRHANNPDAPWAKNTSRMVAQRMIEDFPGREPVWGWRHDTQEIMERQIDLAADNGIDFFLFCWYWRDDKGSCSSMHGMNGWKVVTCYPTCNTDMGTLKR